MELREDFRMERKERKCPDSPQNRQSSPGEKRNRAPQVKFLSNVGILHREHPRSSGRPQHQRHKEHNRLSCHAGRTDAVCFLQRRGIVRLSRIEVAVVLRDDVRKSVETDLIHDKARHNDHAQAAVEGSE